MSPFLHEQAFRATVLPRRWPNRLAEQVASADFLTPFVYSILTDSALADDYVNSRHGSSRVVMVQTLMDGTYSEEQLEE